MGKRVRAGRSDIRPPTCERIRLRLQATTMRSRAWHAVPTCQTSLLACHQNATSSAKLCHRVQNSSHNHLNANGRICEPELDHRRLEQSPCANRCHYLHGTQSSKEGARRCNERLHAAGCFDLATSL